MYLSLLMSLVKDFFNRLRTISRRIKRSVLELI